MHQGRLSSPYVPNTDGDRQAMLQAIGVESVEALFAGPEAAVEDMLRACRDGPPASAVSAVIAESAEPPDGDGFLQLPTA